jgi:hypothetical protein
MGHVSSFCTLIILICLAKNKYCSIKEILIGADKKVGLEINTEKHMFICRHQIAGQNYNINVVKVLRKCVQLKYLGNYSKKSKLRKSKLYSGNGRYHSDYNFCLSLSYLNVEKQT